MAECARLPLRVHRLLRLPSNDSLSSEMGPTYGQRDNRLELDVFRGNELWSRGSDIRGK